MHPDDASSWWVLHTSDAGSLLDSLPDNVDVIAGRSAWSPGGSLEFVCVVTPAFPGAVRHLVAFVAEGLGDPADVEEYLATHVHRDLGAAAAHVEVLCSG